MFTFVTLKA